MLVPFAAGQRVTATALNAAHDIIQTKSQTTDQTVNNSTTLVSSTSLVIPVAANSRYVWESQLCYTAATTPDFKFNLLLPTLAAVRQAQWKPDVAIAALPASVDMSAVEVSNFNSGAMGTGTLMTIRPSGEIVTGANAGSVTVQFAQAAANVSDCVLRISSWIRLTKVA